MRKVAGGIYLLYAGLIFAALMLVACPLIVLATLLFKRKTAREAAFAVLRVWAFLFSLSAFFWMRSINRDKVDTARAYIYTGNHSSYLDAVAVALLFPQTVSPLGKIEMAKVPVFGWIYERVVVMIDRSSKESRERSVADLKTEINGGSSILIFPEGTMNKSAALLTAFYDGAFRIAIETQTPILPFVIVNAKELLPRTAPLNVKPGFVTVVFGSPVEVSGMNLEDVTRLKDSVYLRMEEMLASYTP